MTGSFPARRGPVSGSRRNLLPRGGLLAGARGRPGRAGLTGRARAAQQRGEGGAARDRAGRPGRARKVGMCTGGRPPLRSAGLGWALGPPGYLGHDGGTSGFRAMLGLRPAAGCAAAVFVNDRAAAGLALAVRRSLDGVPEN